MLRVRTALSGFTGGPGLMTQYFLTPNEDAAAVVRCRQYVHDLIGTALGLVLCNTVTWLVNHEVDVVNSANGQTTNTLVDGSSHTATGGGGASAAPVAAAGLIHWRTATWVEGRHLQGRTFVSPMASAKVYSDGALIYATKTSVDTALATYLAAIDAGDSQVVWSRPRVAKPQATPPVEARDGAVANITAADISSKLAVLTSRRD